MSSIQIKLFFITFFRLLSAPLLIYDDSEQIRNGLTDDVPASFQQHFFITVWMTPRNSIPNLFRCSTRIGHHPENDWWRCGWCCSCNKISPIIAIFFEVFQVTGNYPRASFNFLYDFSILAVFCRKVLIFLFLLNINLPRINTPILTTKCCYKSATIVEQLLAYY